MGKIISASVSVRCKRGREERTPEERVCVQAAVAKSLGYGSANDLPGLQRVYEEAFRDNIELFTQQKDVKINWDKGIQLSLGPFHEDDWKNLDDLVCAINDLFIDARQDRSVLFSFQYVKRYKNARDGHAFAVYPSFFDHAYDDWQQVTDLTKKEEKDRKTFLIDNFKDFEQSFDVKITCYQFIEVSQSRK